MEASSPLAAMQPPSFGMPTWGRGDIYTSHPHAHINSYAPGAFNFKDISMMSSANHPDYFNVKKPIRGSSPTASLAADLSQNFHIDMRYSFSPFFNYLLYSYQETLLTAS